VARLSAHGTELIRLRKQSPTKISSVSLSFRSDGAVLRKLKNGTYDSGWKLYLRRTLTPQEELISDLKTKGWQEVKGHG
jgi:hypothetical protein